MMGRIAAGLAALLLFAAVLVGVPIFLLLAVGDPLPSTAQWQSILNLEPDWGSQLLLTKLLPCIAWAAWALFAIPWTSELVSRATHNAPGGQIWVFRPQQKVAEALIAAILVMLAGAAAMSSAPPARAQTSRVEIATSHSIDPRDGPGRDRSGDGRGRSVDRASVATGQDIDYRVRRGDNLWNIAQRLLGAGTDYPKIVQASEHIAQTDGRHLSDPNLIIPGWRLAIPAPGQSVSSGTDERKTPPTSPRDSEPGRPSDPAGKPGASSESTPATPAPTHGLHTRPAGVSAAAQSTDAPNASTNDRQASNGVDAAPLTIGSGIAAFIAAGLIAALGRRRQHQRRQRRLGERIAMPTPEMAEVESKLRLVADPLNAERLRDSLRLLQVWSDDAGTRLPELLAVRVCDDEIAVYLATAAPLPWPYQSIHSDGSAWRIPPGAAVPSPGQAISPYPALTTIGTDARGGVLLLDLEQLGSLNVSDSDGRSAHAMLTAIAVELATNPWSENARVSLVGLPLALARQLDPFRTQIIDDVEGFRRTLRAEAAELQAALASYNAIDLRDARARALGDESWSPHVVIIADPGQAELRAELNRYPSGLGIATVAVTETAVAAATIAIAGPAAAEFHADITSMPALPFTPQLLAKEALRGIQSLIDTSAHPAHTPPRRIKLPASREATVSDPQRPGGNAPASRIARVGEEAVRSATSAEPGPRADVRTEIDHADPVRSHWNPPYVRLLGAVDVLNLPEGTALPGRGLELLAYLLTQTGPMSGAQIQQALWPDTYDRTNNNTHTLAKQVRSTLGTDAAGRSLLPGVRNGGGFTVHDAVHSDWDDFNQLTKPDVTNASTDNLVRALRLVRGAPFTGAGRRRGWWAWRAPLEEEMIAAILDTAEELVARSLGHGAWDQARFAARIAQATDPLNETGWRLDLRTALAAGQDFKLDQIVDDLYDRVGAGDINYIPDDETQVLIEQAARRRREA